MRDQEESLADKPCLEYFVVSLQFDGLWFAYLHEYLAGHCDLEICMRMSRRVTKTFVG